VGKDDVGDNEPGSGAVCRSSSSDWLREGIVNDGLPQRILSGGIERRLGNKSTRSPSNGVNGGSLAGEGNIHRVVREQLRTLLESFTECWSSGGHQ
jgi:hypothetical protein